MQWRKTLALFTLFLVTLIPLAQGLTAADDDGHFPAPVPAQGAFAAADQGTTGSVPANLAGADDGDGRSGPPPAGFLTGPNGGDPLQIALDYLAANREAYGLAEADLADVIVTDHYVSRHTNTTHIYLRQRYQGIEVFNGNVNVNIAADGSVINLGSSFVPNLARAVAGEVPALTAIEGARAAADALRLTPTAPLVVREALGGPAEEAVLSGGGISQNPIPVKLVYQPVGEGQLRLAWNVVIYVIDGAHWWDVRVDAETGRMLSQVDYVAQDQWRPAASAGLGTAETTAAQPLLSPISEVSAQVTTQLTGTYRVYTIPVESPIHTSPAPPADARQLAEEPAHPAASPFGWHDTDGATGAEFTTTQGNNVHAYTDVNADNVPDAGSSPDGGSSLLFDFSLDLTQAPSTYRPAAVTNLFYWNNLMHDVNYLYGFDEASGNFQENNYGNGGAGGDYVLAEAQDGSGTNNANFGSPPDGLNPRMQMYIWTLTSPDRDGDFDNGIITHEYGHGISTRLTGGPANSGCLSNNEQMGEGWSDWMSLIMSMESGDAGVDARGIGTYALGEPPTGDGIRPAPYSTDMTVNAFTYGDIGSQTIPHGVGFVWATMLWEMNWALIDVHGFNPDIYGNWTTGGNNLAHQLIIDGMKLQSCSPGFVDGRDAILLADQNLTGGANQCLIWEAFAKRGLGVSANQGSSASTTDGTEAFDVPTACQFVNPFPATQNVCAPDDADYVVNIGDGFAAPVTMSSSGQPAGTTATFNPNPVPSAPGSTDFTIGNTGAAPAGQYSITITGTDGVTTTSGVVGLRLFDTAPATPSLLAPVDGAIDVARVPTFEWDPVTQGLAFTIELDDDPGFGSIEYTQTVTDVTSHAVETVLRSETVYYWRVRPSNVCGTGSSSPVFSFTTRATAPILLVDDDDNSPDVRSYYTATLDALGVSYDVWDTENSDDEPGNVALSPYSTVIWFTGHEYGGTAGPGPAGEASLAQWLDASNCLFLSSQDYFFDRGLTTFMQNYLGVSAVGGDNGDFTSVTGAGTVFSGLGPYSVVYPYIDYADDISPDGTAELALAGNNGNGAAINKDDGIYRTTFWAFGFEAIDGADNRTEIMTTLLEWCNVGPDVTFSPQTIEVTTPLSTTVTRTITISNQGALDLDWQIDFVETGAPSLSAISIPTSSGEFPRGATAPSPGMAPAAVAGERASGSAELQLLPDAVTAYGVDLLNSELVSFSTQTPDALNTISTMVTAGFYAGDFLGGDFSTLYAINNATATLYAIDTTTGVETAIGPSTPAAGHTWTGLSGDRTSGNMYATSTDCTSNSTLYTVDLATGTVSTVGTAGGVCIIDIAVNAAGEMYGLDILADELLSIDKTTGAATVIGSVGFDASFAQGMDFDEVRGVLYLAAFNAGTFEAELRIADTTTGATLLVGPLGAGSGVELDAFAIATGGLDWVYALPASGSVPAGITTTIDVVFDATAVIPRHGTYTASLNFYGNASNDLDPGTVTMHVTRADVELQPPAASRTGDPSTTVTHTVQMTNTGFFSETYEVTASGNVWPTSFSQNTVTLDPGEGTAVDVLVEIPAGAPGGISDTVSVSATSQTTPPSTDASLLTTSAANVYGVSVAPPNATALAGVGEQVSHTVYVTNTGNVSDTFDLAISGNAWPTSLSQSTVTLAAGAATGVEVTVNVPSGAGGADSDTASVSATSQTDAGATAASLLTTTVAAEYGVTVIAPVDTITDTIGQLVTHTLLVTNTGNVSDIFDLALSGNAWPATLSQSALALNAGEGAMVTVSVVVGADDDIVTVTATSQSNPSATASADLTTVSEGAVLYLPAVHRE